MPGDYLPQSDEGLMVWAENASTLITADAVAYGLTAGIATTFSGLVTTYKDAVLAAKNPATRGSSTCFAMAQARKSLIAYTRPMVRTIQGTLSVTPQMKHDLGINVRDTQPSPINPPTEPPVAEVAEMNGWMVSLKLRGAGATRRGKPAGVAGAHVYSYVGATAPTDPALWKFEGATSRASFEVAFPGELPAGTKVFVCANWVSPRFATGPACAPIGLILGGGVPETNLGAAA